MINLLVLSPKEGLVKLLSGLEGIYIQHASSSQSEALDYLSSATMIPEIAIITEGLFGDIGSIDFVLKLHKDYSSIRILYLAGEIKNEEEQKLNALSQLVDAGIFDIYCQGRLNKTVLENLIRFEKTEFDNDYLYTYRRRGQDLIQDTAEAIIDEGRENVFMISSIKPGTGKTFVSTNIATAIAKFGKSTKRGQAPKVAILEGDLQTLSVGTLLGIENETFNLRTALLKVATIVDDDGSVRATKEQLNEVNDFIKECLLHYSKVPNLFALVGSQLNFSDLGSVNPYHYFYLIDVIAEWFDIVIIDANSSLEHTTTGPMLQLANRCYYVIDLDFNGIRSNLRYRQELKDLKVLDKIHYVLNKAITRELENTFLEKLDYGEKELFADGFKISGRIPMVDVVVAFNRMFDQTPIVLDKTLTTLQARIEFTKLSDQIWKMDNILDLKLETEGYKELAMGKRKKKKKE